MIALTRLKMQSLQPGGALEYENDDVLVPTGEQK